MYVCLYIPPRQGPEVAVKEAGYKKDKRDKKWEGYKRDETKRSPKNKTDICT